MKSLFAGALLALAACMAMPATASSSKQQIDASMLLSGNITVSPDGSVQSYGIDQSGKVPAAVMQLLAKTIPRWRFQPVLRNGQPVAAMANMSLRIVATPQGNHRYNIAVAGTRFGDPSNGTIVSLLRTNIGPMYPREAIKERVSGTTYLIVQVDRQGHVTKAAAEQVNLRIVGPNILMKRWRKLLADASVKWIMKRAFKVPTTGPEATKDHWLVRVPVTFRIRGPSSPRIASYGEWSPYAPGPRATIPWAQAELHTAESPDAMPDHGVQLAGASLHRIEPPQS